jgi:hypothetical protein
VVTLQLVDILYPLTRIKEKALLHLSASMNDNYVDCYSTYILYFGVPINAWTSQSSLYTIKVVRGDTNELLAKKTSCSPFGKEDFISFFVSTIDKERKKNLIRRKDDSHENNTREDERWLCLEEYIGTYRDDAVARV